MACEDEADKHDREVDLWLRSTAQKFWREGREQEETRVFNGFAVRLVMHPHPIHGNLTITAYQINLDAIQRQQDECMQSPPALFCEVHS